MDKRVLFVFGLGYVGKHLGAVLLSQGWRVIGTTHTTSKIQMLKEDGFEVVRWEGPNPLPTEVLRQATHILITIPPDEQGDVVARKLDFQLLSPQWVGYLSATSVYGDHQGAWVDEESLAQPQSARGKQRLLAESQWLEKNQSTPPFPVHIFRLSGIYGPGRSALDAIRAGKAQRIDKAGHLFSRIHIDDIIAVLIASMETPHPGSIYNLADDQPAALSDVIAYGCDLLGMPNPPLIPFEKALLSPMLREFYRDHKQVSNDKIKRELGIQLKYPSYQDGLKHC